MPSTDGHLKIFYDMGLTAVQHCHIERRIECWGICVHILEVWHAPESIHAGFPFLPFCILAIVPVAVLSDTEHLVLAIDAMLAATTIMMVGLAIQACLFFRRYKHYQGLQRPRATQAKNKAEVLFYT
jgi:hypothetical protein